MNGGHCNRSGRDVGTVFPLWASPPFIQGGYEMGNEGTEGGRRGGGSVWTAPRLAALGIRKNTQALQHMLKHPFLYHSSKPKRDALQKYYAPKEKRVKLHLTECTDGRSGPPGTEVAVTMGPSKGHAFPGPPIAPLPAAVTV